MPKPKLVDLSEFLGPGPVDLSEFLEPKPELPSESLSPPEAVIVHWIEQTCSCSRTYECQEHGATIRHTLLRRIGFGMRPIGKVYIPAVPGMDLSNVPVEVKVTKQRIFACPSCIGMRASLPLFPEQPPADHAARWLEMHKGAKHHDVEAVLKDMHKRGIDFDDLLAFKTTELDLQATVASQVLCDPERNIEP